LLEYSFLSGGTLKQGRRYGKSRNTKIYIAGRCRELLTGAEIEYMEEKGK
jgi:hypothetical protein